MKRLFKITVVLTSLLGMCGMLSAQDAAPTSPNYPEWAYAIPAPTPPDANPAAAAKPGAVKMLSLPGTTLTFTPNKVRGRSEDGSDVRVAPADWYPEDHPAMPKIVAEGDNSRSIVACSLCHLPNGKGRPENAPPAGQTKEYIMMTLMDMKNGLRESADTRKGNSKTMNSFAKAMTHEEMEQSAEYFASMKWTPWISVKETDQVAKMRSSGGIWVPLEGAEAGVEPIGMRVIETPVNVEYTEKMRNPRSGFIAYVPMGSVAKGKVTVTTGDNGKTLACTICHGADLNGVGNIPGIAARSPSYIARQLFNFQAGTRKGEMANLMQPVVAKLTNEDFVNITAYLAGLPAQAQTPTFNQK